MMKEQEVKELFELPIVELAHKLFRLMPVDRKISEELFQRHWNKLSEEDKHTIGKEIAELTHIQAIFYARKHPWMGNPYL